MQFARPYQRIGRYEVVSLVGQGTYSEVYRAKDTALKRDIALKVLRPQSFLEYNDGEASLHEARVLAKLDHPNIVTIFDTFQSGRSIYIAMEYLSGGTLATVNAKLPATQLLDIFCQVAGAIAYAHDKGFVHGDIKPSNIAISHDGVPKVIDFGLAKLTGQASLLSTLPNNESVGSAFLGTLPFMAPELIRGEEHGPLSDVFALGAVFYQLVYGKAAFSGSNEAEILNAVLSGRLSALEVDCKEEVAAIVPLIERMLDSNKNKRPTSMSKIADQLSLLASHPSQRTSLRAAAHFGNTKALMPLWKTGAIAALVGIFGMGYSHDPYALNSSDPVSIMSSIDAGFHHLKRYGLKGKLEAAQANFESVLLTDPENAAATAGLALTLLRKYTAENKDPALYSRALETAELALSLDGNLAIGHLAMGQILKQKGRYEGARTFLQQALMLDPGNQEANIALAFVDHRTGLTTRAIERLERLSGQSPDRVEYIRPLAGFYYAMGQYAKAEQAFRQQISLSPDDSRAYSNLSAVQHLQGETLAAISTLQRGLKIRPSRLLYSNLGTYLFFQKQYPQAIRAYEGALQLPGGTNDFRIWANLADAYNMVSGKKMKSRLAYQRAHQLLIRQYPAWMSDKTLISKVGLFQAKIGDFGAAEDTIDPILESGPVAPDILFRAAVIKELAGKRSDALRLLERALIEGYPLMEIENTPELFGLRQSSEFHLLQTRLSIENNT